MELSSYNCRRGLTPTDLDYIKQTLNLSEVEFSGRNREVQVFLDEPKLFNALIEEQAILPVSLKFYFYVLLRHTLLEKDIKAPDVADYLGSMLDHATRSEKIFTQGDPHFYLCDAFKKIDESDPQERFFVQVRFANLSLFMTGIFADRLHYREVRKGAPSIEYYSSVGKGYYTAASAHRLAQEYTLEDVFKTLGHSFDNVCEALNNLSDRLLFLSPPPPDNLL